MYRKAKELEKPLLEKNRVGEFIGRNFKTYYKTMQSGRCINGQRTGTQNSGKEQGLERMHTCIVNYFATEMMRQHSGERRVISTNGAGI